MAKLRQGQGAEQRRFPREIAEAAEVRCESEQQQALRARKVE
jgi:hypothetical protein